MKNSRIKTPFAKKSESEINNSSQLVSAGSAERRLDYYCPDCSERVRKRKSSKGTYHFFHLGNECSGGGLETTLHLLTKSVIEREKKIWIPDCIAKYKIICPAINNDGISQIFDENSIVTKDLRKDGLKKIFEIYYLNPSNSNDDKQCVAILETLSINTCFGIKNIQSLRIEQSVENIRPDLIAKIDGRDYLIEVANTHFVDNNKLQKIQKLDIPTIEIDVSQLTDISYESIKELITLENENTYWLHYSNSLLSEFVKLKHKFECEYIEITKLGRVRDRLRRLAQEKHEINQEKKQAEQKLQLDEQKRIAERANAMEAAKGLLELYGSPKQIEFAITIRQERIRKFGMDDLLVQQVRNAGDWIKCKKKNQLFYPRPYCLSQVFNWYEDQQKKDAQRRVQAEERKTSLEHARQVFGEGVDRLMPKTDGDISGEKAKGKTIICPNCNAETYEFKELVPNSYYARICYRCKHSEKI